MRRVKTITEKKPIDKTSGDVARVIVNGTVVAILMLQQVDGHDSPLRDQPRNPKINQRRLPIQKQQYRKKYKNRGAFPLKAVIQVRFFFAPAGDISRLVSMHQPDNREREDQQVQPVLAKIYHRTPNKIFLGVILGVMAFVVDGNDCGSGLSGAKAQKIFKRSIPISVGKGAAMDVVVLDNAGDECKHAGCEQEQPVTKQTTPLREKENT